MRSLFYFKKEGADIEKKGTINVLRYSMQLVLLNKLWSYKTITEEEYQKIKARLMQDYNVVSEWTA